MGDSLEIAEELPPIPAEAREAWKDVQARCKSEPLKIGMQACLGGRSYRESARIAGLADQSTIREGLRRYGLRDLAVKSDRVAANHREIAYITTNQQLERLTSGEPADKNLAIVGGISTDKLAAYERWVQGQQRTDTFADAIGAFAAKLVSGGARLQARLTAPSGATAEIELGSAPDDQEQE